MPACAPVSAIDGTPRAWSAMDTSVALWCSPVASSMSSSRGSGSSVIAPARASSSSVISPMADTTTTRSHPVARSRAMRVATRRSGDGTSFRAFHAWPSVPTGKAIVILPDVRGLHHYYEELARRFAEIGVEAVAIDYFGRTAGLDERGEEFDYAPHVAKTTWAGISADFNAAANYLRSDADKSRARALFAIGFCMGGRNAFLSATLDKRPAGTIGFYGFPGGAARNDSPAPLDLIDDFDCPVLGIFGGADQAIPVAIEIGRA